MLIMLENESHQFINNEDLKLQTVLDSLLRIQSRASFVSCYFGLSGYYLLRDALWEAPQLRLVIGEELNLEKRPTEIGIFEVLDFINFLQRTEVEIRINKSSFLHAKFYLFCDKAIIGSSNLTKGGLSSNNELNLITDDPAIIKNLEKQFEIYWERAERYNEILVEVLEQFLYKNISEFARNRLEKLEAIQKICEEQVELRFKGKDISKETAALYSKVIFNTLIARFDLDGLTKLSNQDQIKVCPQCGLRQKIRQVPDECLECGWFGNFYS